MPPISLKKVLIGATDDGTGAGKRIKGIAQPADNEEITIKTKSINLLIMQPIIKYPPVLQGCVSLKRYLRGRRSVPGGKNYSQKYCLLYPLRIYLAQRKHRAAP